MKKYKTYLKISLLIPIALFPLFTYFVFNYKMLYMNQEYPMWLHIKNIINTHDSEIYDLMMIGDSRAKAGFIPNVNDFKKSINLAVGGGTPIEGYYTLENYLKNNSAPKNLILSYGPFHLDAQDCYWTRTVKFDFLKDSEYREVENIAKKINDLKTLGIGLTYTDYLSPVKFGDDFKNGILGRRWNKNIETYIECDVSKGHYYFGREEKADGLNAESQKQCFQEARLLHEYFIKLLQLANANNIKVYYYTMPFNQSSFEIMNTNYRHEYNKYINQMATDYDIKVCNNLSFMTNDNFGDPSHLYKGSKITTKEIYNCVFSK